MLWYEASEGDGLDRAVYPPQCRAYTPHRCRAGEGAAPEPPPRRAGPDRIVRSRSPRTGTASSATEVARGLGVRDRRGRRPGRPDFSLPAGHARWWFPCGRERPLFLMFETLRSDPIVVRTPKPSGAGSSTFTRSSSGGTTIAISFTRLATSSRRRRLDPGVGRALARSGPQSSFERLPSTSRSANASSSQLADLADLTYHQKVQARLHSLCC